MSYPGGGGSASLSDLIALTITTLSEIIPPLESIQTQMKQSDGDLTKAVTTLVGDYDAGSKSAPPALTSAQVNNQGAMQFAGLGAQSFFQATQIHAKVAQFFVDAFKGVDDAAQALEMDLANTSLQYDGQLSSALESNYIPYWDVQAAHIALPALLSLDPATAMGQNVILAADNNQVVSSILRTGPSPLTELLTGAYQQLLARADSLSFTLPATPGQTPADQALTISDARAAVKEAITWMHQAINQVYTNWGNAVQSAFSTFTTAVTTAEQQLQPVIDLLTKPQSAASIFDLIQMVSGTDSPIAITQIGPNRILVSISGTDAFAWNYDTDIWNALGTGMGQDMPYEQDVIEAIQAYCAEHGLTNPEVVLAGHSLGGMVAQQVAEKGIFNVTQVVTYGSPVMGDPVPGVQYDIYEAQGDAVPLLSRYENPTLPASLQDMTHLFPNFQTNYEGFTNPLSPSGFLHDIKSAGRDIGATWDNLFSAGENVTGLGFMLAEASLMGNFVPIDVKVGGVNIPVGTIISGNSRSPLIQASPADKIAFMDPHGLYGQSIQNVPDLTSGSVSVHSDYGKSNFLEHQQIYQNMPAGDFLTNTEYFGMPNTYQTTQINQYMQNNSSLGQILSAIGH